VYHGEEKADDGARRTQAEGVAAGVGRTKASAAGEQGRVQVVGKGRLSRSIMTQRRYRDAEVRRILELATRSADAESRAAPAADGLTLAEIQSIGVEVGVAPEEIARAAASLDARGRKKRTSWGMPIEVGHSVALPRPLSDDEWERLVGELRSTFGARGRVRVQGGLREWTNGNLHACAEPTQTGYRLRMGTVKGDAAGINALGATGLAAGAFVFGAALMTGNPGPDAIIGVMLGASGTGAFLANLLRLPRWADRRERQMKHVEARVAALLDSPSDD
jgi:hypothetical protein